MKYFLNPYCFINQSNDHILVGFSQNFILFENTKQILDFFDQLTSTGINSAVIETNEELSRLLHNNFLLQKEALDFQKVNRTELFFQTLGLNDLDETIYNSPILIFGAGGGGGTLAYLLAQFGFNNLSIIDPDIVNPTDISKTMVYNATDIGEKKVYALKKRLAENFSCCINALDEEVTHYDQMEYLIRKHRPELIIYAIDPNPIHKFNLNEIAFKNRIPFVMMSYSYEWLICGPFFNPSSNYPACYKSVGQLEIDYGNGKIDIRTINRLFKDRLTHPSISFNVNILANIILKDIVFFLQRDYERVSTLNAVLKISTLDLEGQIFTLECDTECLICH